MAHGCYTPQIVVVIVAIIIKIGLPSPWVVDMDGQIWGRV